LDACDEFKDWDGQSEPTVRHQRGKPLVIATKVNDVIGTKKVLHFLSFISADGTSYKGDSDSATSVSKSEMDILLQIPAISCSEN